MNARVRGHYRIDAAGRVEPVSDVNASLHTWAYQPPPKADKAAEQRSRLIKICMAGLALFCMGLGLMASLPTIQRMIVASEAARTASIRRTFIHAHPGVLPTTSDHHWRHHTVDN